MMKLNTPLKDDSIKKLKTGDKVLLSGVLYTARDAAHKKFLELIKKGKALPFNIKNQVLYYTGPTPAKPGCVIGSAGPTTSSRMDKYTLPLLRMGLKGMIGKGERSPEIRKAIKKYKAVYFIAVGGTGALLSKTVKGREVIAFHELGPEAVLRLEVKDFPAIVAIDSRGKDLFTRSRDS